jgi:4-hydroxy-tetrahydrodipicolinate synthase
MRCYDVAVDEANGKTPVWVGVSHLGTAPAVALTKYAKNVGADGIIVMPPLAGNKESTLALNEHFRTVIEKADVPVMIQDPEDFNGVVLNLTLCSKLAMEYDNLVSIKVEGGNTLEKIEDIRRLIGDRVTILGGMSGRDLFEELDRGAHGNVPDCCLSDLLVGAFENYRARNMDRAKEFFSRLQPWLDFVSLHPLLSHEIEKETLRLRDVIKSSHTRSPHVPMSKEAKAQLAVLVKNMGLKNPDM